MSSVDSARSDYQAFGQGDLATLGESFAEDAV
jgi:ketosteroid isomerase-like protein